MQGFRRIQAWAPLLAALALLALAGPAAAHDGSKHWDDDEPTGTIASYDSESGVLTIDLADGGSASGLVTSRTWIDAGHKSCGDDNGGETSRKAKQARRGDKQARTGDRGCHERRNGRHGHGEGRGWHHGWRHNHGDESDLVAGAVVEDAILILKDGKAWFAKIDLD